MRAKERLKGLFFKVLQKKKCFKVFKARWNQNGMRIAELQPRSNNNVTRETP